MSSLIKVIFMLFILKIKLTYELQAGRSRMFTMNPLSYLLRQQHLMQPLAAPDIVRIDVLYETLCPGCRDEMTRDISRIMRLIGDRVDLHLVPFGFSEVQFTNGQWVFEAQHGPPEAYGNRLHASAVQYFRNMTVAAVFNACLMGEFPWGTSSDDRAADACGTQLGINVEPIKAMAKSEIGIQLMKQMSDVTNYIKPPQLPFTLINGKTYDEKGDLFQYVCRNYRSPPAACYGQQT